MPSQKIHQKLQAFTSLVMIWVDEVIGEALGIRPRLSRLEDWQT
jgi:hypothetical protein